MYSCTIFFHEYTFMPRQIRDDILDAAERLLADFGYSMVTMEEVAREAGVGRTTIYLHFKTKEEVALAVLDRVHARNVDNLRRVAAEGEGEPAAQLRRVLLERLRFGFEHGRWRREDGDMHAAIRSVYVHRREQYIENEAALVAGLLRAGIERGEFAVGDAPLAARALVLATNALMPYSLTPRMRDDWPEVERTAEAMIDLMLNGLCTR
jgi:AcrR family transcriptional regulator